MILSNIQQLVIGVRNFVSQSTYSRYSYCEDNEVIFLLEKLSELNIKLDIQGAWNPTIRPGKDLFIMEQFIDKGYSEKGLKVLNNIRNFMKASVLSDINKEGGGKMARWAICSDLNKETKWIWPKRRTPIEQNNKLWRERIRGGH